MPVLLEVDGARNGQTNNAQDASDVSSGSTSQTGSELLPDDPGELLEDLLTPIHGNGRYQRLIAWIIIFPSFFGLSFIQSLVYFVIPIPNDYRCRLPNQNGFKSGYALLPPSVDNATSNSQCEMYDVDYGQYTVNSTLNETALSEYLQHFKGNLSTVRCQHGWIYDTSIYESTIVTEWDLVCGRTFLPTLAYILTSIGGGLGIAAGGYFADHYGRKNTYFLALLIIVSFGTATAFSSSYEVYVVLTTLLATGSNSFYQVPYTIGVEILAPKHRSGFSVGVTVAFAAGGLGLAGLAYFIRSWRMLTIAGTVPFAIFFLFWFIMPESPHWLLTQNRLDTLETLLRKMAKINKAENFLPDAILNIQSIKKYHQATQNAKHRARNRFKWLGLFRGRFLRRQTIILSYLSCAVQICYSGLNYYAPSLGDDPYLSFFLSSLIELPGSIFTGFVADRLGRRLTTVLCFIGSSAGCFGILGVSDNYWGLLGVFLLAKMLVTSGFMTQELMLYEAFPTEIRAEGVAFVTTVSYVASNLGPVIVYLRFSEPVLPFVVFGAISLVGIVSVLFVPETHNTNLPDTIEECERRGRPVTLKSLLISKFRKRAQTGMLLLFSL
ncbi:beta-alanine transporter-like [Paramacrobiotus metropolitanus]|uniref:beta-alanine transporter-like n=1 Tax=Paramacrobiotus metropolitanus TaxID=2943436 RepID=UPI00244603DD|nr:beta-alanine transporter-like [Paramacrobiotus metropolitanus]